MTKDPARNAELRQEIEANKALKKRYLRAQQAIAGSNLDTQRSFTTQEVMIIQEAKNAVSKIEANEGYHYLQTMQTKLKEDTIVMEDYLEFVRDSNASFVTLYGVLETRIAEVDAAIANAKREHNEGLEWFDPTRYIF